MAKVIQFPQQVKPVQDPFKQAIAAIEKRVGVSFQDYLGRNGKRSAETQAVIDKSLRRETFRIRD